MKFLWRNIDKDGFDSRWWSPADFVMSISVAKDSFIKSSGHALFNERWLREEFHITSWEEVNSCVPSIRSYSRTLLDRDDIFGESLWFRASTNRVNRNDPREITFRTGNQLQWSGLNIYPPIDESGDPSGIYLARMLPIVIIRAVRRSDSPLVFDKQISSDEWIIYFLLPRSSELYPRRLEWKFARIKPHLSHATWLFMTLTFSRILWRIKRSMTVNGRFFRIPRRAVCQRTCSSMETEQPVNEDSVGHMESLFVEM